VEIRQSLSVAHALTANKTNVERVHRQWPLAWEPGLNGSGVDPQLVWEWVQHSCISCASMLQSWSGVEAEGAEWRWKGSEVARGGWRRGREVIPWHLISYHIWVLCHFILFTPSPLVVEDRGLMLPLSPSPGHQMQLVDVLPQVGVECLLEVVD